MTVPVATVKLIHGARLFAEAVHTYIRQFGQLAFLAVPPVQNPLALFFSSSINQVIAFLLCFLLPV
jgi:hypothetical protein